MDAHTPTRYDPRTFKALTYHDATSAFADGSDTPRDYLERCLKTIAEREPVVKAFPAINEPGARAAADESTQRWKNGNPLSPIDGLPIGIKDLLETKDMPTQMGCDAYIGNFPKRDNAAVWALREAGAVIVAKTVTAELGGSHPGPTTNPFDPARTPGGSSSGSAAAVAARMLPTAIAAISTLAIPIVGVYSSALLLGEQVGTREWISLALVVVAIGIVLSPAVFWRRFCL